MREIKFRGQNVRGLLVYGNYAHIKKDFSTVRKGHYISNSDGAPFAYLIRPETLGQYTGLKDKNGKEIYEGDIVRYPADLGLNKKWDSFLGKVAYEEDRPAYNVYGNDNAWVLTSGVEVVGNIHENPELIQSHTPEQQG